MIKITENEDIFYEECANVVSGRGSHKILCVSKTPMFLLPSELSSKPRREYYDVVTRAVKGKRLNVDYVFALDSTTQGLSMMFSAGKPGEEQTKEHLARLRNLLFLNQIDLRSCSWKDFNSCVLAEKIGMILFKEPISGQTKLIKFVYGQEVEKFRKFYGRLFGKLTTVDQGGVDWVLMGARMRHIMSSLESLMSRHFKEGVLEQQDKQLIAATLVTVGSRIMERSMIESPKEIAEREGEKLGIGRKKREYLFKEHIVPLLDRLDFWDFSGWRREEKREPPKSIDYDERDVLQVCISGGRHCVSINAELPPNLTERVFAGMFLLAAASKKRDNGAVDRKHELRLARGQQQLRDIRVFLASGRFKGKAKRVVACGKGKVKLEFDSKCIIIDRSVCTFESSHRKYVEDRINHIYHRFGHEEIMKQKKLTEQEMKDILCKMGISLQKEERRLIQQIKSMVRHTMLVKDGVEIMGWRFHDGEWEKEWMNLLRKCDKVLELMGCSIDRRYEIGLLA
jgi:hypothetical protein